MVKRFKYSLYIGSVELTKNTDPENANIPATA